jgi:hypothetical protein
MAVSEPLMRWRGIRLAAAAVAVASLAGCADVALSPSSYVTTPAGTPTRSAGTAVAPTGATPSASAATPSPAAAAPRPAAPALIDGPAGHGAVQVSGAVQGRLDGSTVTCEAGAPFDGSTEEIDVNGTLSGRRYVLIVGTSAAARGRWSATNGPTGGRKPYASFGAGNYGNDPSWGIQGTTAVTISSSGRSGTITANLIQTVPTKNAGRSSIGVTASWTCP